MDLGAVSAHGHRAYANAAELTFHLLREHQVSFDASRVAPDVLRALHHELHRRDNPVVRPGVEP